MVMNSVYGDSASKTSAIGSIASLQPVPIFDRTKRLHTTVEKTNHRDITILSIDARSKMRDGRMARFRAANVVVPVESAHLDRRDNGS